MKTLFLAFAVAAATLMSGLSAQAGYLTGSGSYSFTLNPATGGTLSTARTAENVNFTSGTGSFAANLTNGLQWSDFSITAPTMSSLTIGDTGAGFGTFVSTANTVDSAIPNTSRTIQFLGDFTPTNTTLFPGALATPAILTITISQSGSSFSGSFTIAMNAPSAVPEPASMAIFGLGAIGIAARRFRRK